MLSPVWATLLSTQTARGAGRITCKSSPAPSLPGGLAACLVTRRLLDCGGLCTWALCSQRSVGRRLSQSMDLCVCVCVCIYIYIYIERERERERETHTHTHTHTYTHTHTHTQVYAADHSSEPACPSGKALGWYAEGPRFESASALLSLQKLWSVDIVL